MTHDYLAEFKSFLPTHIDANLLYKALHKEPLKSIRINPNKVVKSLDYKRVPWSEHGYYLPENTNVLLDPLYHAGAYCLHDASSMFIEQIIRPLNTKTLRVLDLNAGEGGMSTHIISLLKRGSLLIANEPNDEYAKILSNNLIHWGKSNCIVTNNKDSEFSFLNNFFDVVFLHAPSSEDSTNVGADYDKSREGLEYKTHEQSVLLNQAIQYVAPGGIVIYSTRSFGENENEDIVSDLLKNNNAETLPIHCKAEWNIIEHKKENVFSYRFYPSLIDGQGFTLSVIRKTDGENYVPPKRLPKSKINIIPQKNRLHYSNLIKNYKSIVYEFEDNVIWSFSSDYRKLLIDVFANCNVLHAGIPLVEIKGNRLNPRPGLAVANSFNDTILPKHEVDKETAMQYFANQSIQTPGQEKGWIQLVYKNIPLGFVKNLGERANNACPKAWAIDVSYDKSKVWSILE